MEKKESPVPMFSLSLSEQQSQISLPSCSKIPNRRVKISKIPDPEKPFGILCGRLGSVYLPSQEEITKYSVSPFQYQCCTEFQQEEL